MVMYLGRPVELAPVGEIFANPRHPYTKALLSATPVADPKRKRENIKLEGELPSPIDPPSGCAFHPRCAYADGRCRRETPRSSMAGASQVFCFGVEEGRVD